jgi:hypothetical protein
MCSSQPLRLAGNARYCGELEAGGESGDREDGDVVFLAEGDGNFAGLPSVGFGGDELLHAFVAEDLA